MPLQRDQLLAMVDKIPAFPQSVHRVISLTAKADCAPKELVSVIEHDPVLTIKVLKLVNSAYFGLRREITSVNHAVVYVGINTIKNLAITVATAGALPKTNKAGLDVDALWRHSLSVGVVARILAAKRGVIPNDLPNYFVAGLLHDIGKILFAHFLPDKYAPVVKLAAQGKYSFSQIENKLFGLDHGEFGAILAEYWKLPGDLVAAIRFHNSMHPDIESDTGLKLCYAISASNAIAHYLFDEGNPEISIAQEVTDWLGAPVSVATASMEGIEDEIEKALAFINIGS